MAKHKPRRRPKPAEVPQQPRDRRAEIGAEIRDVQQQIEARRCDTPVIRTPEDLTTWERTIAELTDRLAALLLAEVMQAALGDPENRLQARSLAQGAGHTLKDQGPRDVTLRTACGPVTIRATYFSRNCHRDKPGKGMYPMLLLWGVHDRCTAAVASETAGPQGHPGDRLPLRHACPCRAASRGHGLGRIRRGPPCDPLH
jgi:hypothetical protein